MADVKQPDRIEVTVRLKRGDYTFHRYVPGDPQFAEHPKALIIFGSGDGGFFGWEDHFCRGMQALGYEVIGFDCAVYAQTDYDIDTLQADFNTIAQSSLTHYGNSPPPLILGGWSMGAAQAVPGAGGPHPPKGLAGLMLLGLGERGRYGVRATDRLDIPPYGPGTFAMADFAHSMDKIRVVQWSGSRDILVSTSWLHTLTAPHKAYIYPGSWHDFDGFSDDFVKHLDETLKWVLSSSELAPSTMEDKNNE